MSSSKFIFYSDPHIHEFSEFSYLLENGITNRLQIALDSIKYVLDYAVENNITTVINGGDLYEHPKMVKTTVASLLTDILCTDTYKNIIHGCITGNHDIVDNDHKYNAVKFMKGFKFAIDASNYRTTKINVGNTDIICLPYLSDSREAIKWLEGLDKAVKEKSIVLAHWSVDGVKYTEDYPVSSSCKTELFEDFPLAFFGHIHLRQILGRKKNIIYPGSLLAHSFHSGGGKGFVVVDTEDYSYEIIDNPLSPAFNQIVVEEDSEEWVKPELTGNNFYRVRVCQEKVDQYKERYLEDRNVHIVPIPKQIESRLKLNEELALDNVGILNQYSIVVDLSNSLKRYGEVLLRKGSQN